MPDREPTLPNTDIQFRPIEETRADIAALIKYYNEMPEICPTSSPEGDIALLFVKIVHDVQAVRVLVGDNLLPQAGVIVRSALESLIYQSACAVSGKALMSFHDKDVCESRTTLRKMQRYDRKEKGQLSTLMAIYNMIEHKEKEDIKFFIEHSALPPYFNYVYRYFSEPVHGLSSHLLRQYVLKEGNVSVVWQSKDASECLGWAAIIMAEALKIYQDQFNIPIPSEISIIIEKYPPPDHSSDSID